jgi:hypothetical protein
MPALQEEIGRMSRFGTRSLVKWTKPFAAVGHLNRPRNPLFLVRQQHTGDSDDSNDHA